MDLLDKWKALEQLTNKDKNMKTFQHKPGSGSLFKNQFKSKDSHPDYTGKIILSKEHKAGDELKISAWKKTSLKGVYLSISENNYEPQVIDNTEIGEEI
jgi:hypothetical protein